MAQGRAAPALAWTPGAARWPWRHRGTRRPAGAARFGGGLRCSSPHDLRIQTPQERCLQMAGGQAGTRAPRCRDAEQTSWGVREDPRPVQKVQSTPTSGVQLLPLIAPQLPGSGIQLVLQAQAAGSAQGGGVEEAGGGGAGGGGQPGIRLGLPAGHSGASVVPPVIGQAASVDEEEEGMQGGALHIHPPPPPPSIHRPDEKCLQAVCHTDCVANVGNVVCSNHCRQSRQGGTPRRGGISATLFCTRGSDWDSTAGRRQMRAQQRRHSQLP